MSESNTPENTTEETKAKKSPSDARIILGPLVKYALMGLVLVSVIISTAIMLDRQLNDIDQAAILKTKPVTTEPESETETDTSTAIETEPSVSFSNETPEQRLPTASVAVTDTAAETPVATVVPASALTRAAEHDIDVATVLQDPVAGPAIEPVDRQSTVNTDVAVANTDAIIEQEPVSERQHRDGHPFDQSMAAYIAEHNAYLNRMDHIYLEDLKASQMKQLQHMRERLARKQQRIKEMEARFKEEYEIRARDVQKMQHWRDNFVADRI